MIKYRSISIPTEMYEEIQEFIFKNHWLGYRSVPEFFREAARKHLATKKLELPAKTKWEIEEDE